MAVQFVVAAISIQDIIAAALQPVVAACAVLC